MAETLEDLFIAFCDEDTPTWTAAARAIGLRAGAEPKAEEFIAAWLAKAPGADDEGEDANIHRFRHACCALASHLSGEEVDRAPFGDVIDREIVGPLSYLAFLGMKGGTVADLASIGLAEDFDRWRAGVIEKRKKEVAKFEGSGKEQALEANKRKLAEIEAVGPESPIPSDFKPAGKIHDHTPWALTSYFAGVRSRRALLGIPLVPLVRGLCEIALERKNGGLPFVLNVPDLLVAIEGEAPEGERAEARSLLVQNLSPAWITERLHYNDYILSLARIQGEGSFFELWGKGLTKPAWLEEDLSRLRTQSDAEALRTAARILRKISSEYFADDFRWQELDDGGRFSLNVFTLLTTRGLEPFRGKKASGKERSALSVRHRLAILIQAIEASYQAREQVLPALVRCLKILLDVELRAVGSKKDDLSEVCKRQVAVVRPLVAEWQLPGTLRKDLATIVCRILLATYRTDRIIFVNLLYTVLFALPDEVLFRELIEYSTEDEVSALVRMIVELIERWRRPPERVGVVHDPTAMDRAYEPDVKAFEIYERFAAKLVSIGGGAKDLTWIEQLPQLVGHLARVPVGYPLGSKAVTEARSERDLVRLDSALFRMLRAKHHGVERWEINSPRGKVDRKGAQWAAQEQQRRIEQRTRETYDRFQRLIDDIQILESDCLPEAGRPKASDELVRQWRRLIASLDQLNRLCDEELPYLERELCGHLLRERIENLEVRLHTLVRILEKEEESVAFAMIEGRVRRTRSEGKKIDLSLEDASLVQEWMLGRYMISELARALRLRALGLLTNLPFVAVWILLPFIACSALHKLGLERWSGVPFPFATVSGLVLVGVFFFEAMRSKTATAATGRFLMPQITAALFLGISEILTNDEAWALAVLEYPWVRAFNILAFLLTGFFFTREVLLGGQLTSKADIHRKNERAGSVMALCLWQSFLLVNLFGLLGGRVMGNRVEHDRFAEAASAFGDWLPLQVHVGPLFLEPAEGASVIQGGYTIYPWALIQWSVQIFFFSAIFERIMKRSD
jgi:hypothetical protein